MILQRAGDDLARRRRSAVGEHDHRRLRVQLLVRGARHLVGRVARPHVDDRLTRLEEERADRERLIDDAAAIVAEIQHDAVRAVGHELLRRVLDLFRRVLVERLQWDVTHVAVEHRRERHRRHVDDRALELELHGLAHAWSRERHAHRRAREATQRVGHLVDLSVRRGHRIHLDDAIAFANSTVFRRRVRKDPTHHDTARGRRLLLFEQHSHAAISSADGPIELVVLLWREQLAVRIVQLADEAMRRLLVDVRALQRVDVPVRHDREHLIEQPGRGVRRRLLEEEPASDDRDQEQRRGGRSTWTEHSSDLEKKKRARCGALVVPQSTGRLP